MTTTHRPGRPGKEAGQEAVEFALLLPLLLLIVFGVLDLGRAFHAAVVVANASRVGARYAMNYPADTAEIKAAARAEADGSGIVLTDGDIAVGCPSGCGSNLPVRVTVTYDFTLVTGFVFPDPSIQIERYTEMLVP